MILIQWLSSETFEQFSQQIKSDSWPQDVLGITSEYGDIVVLTEYLPNGHF